MNDDSLRSLIHSLEIRLLQPGLRKSSREIGELLADDFVEYGSSGRTYNKQQALEALQQEIPTERVISEFRTLVLAPDVVLATYRATRRNESGDEPVHSMHSSIWKWIGNRWQVVFHQGTLTNEAPSAP